jgi:hypothetical protein
LPDQRLVSLRSEVHIPHRGLPAPFLQGVQDVHSLGEFCHVQDSMLDPRMDSDLPNARSDRMHDLPVHRVEPPLDTSKLKPREPARVTRKGANIGS